MQKCDICHREMERHAITGEITCFLHGNPEGCEFEQAIYEKRVLKLKEKQ